MNEKTIFYHFLTWYEAQQAEKLANRGYPYPVEYSDASKKDDRLERRANALPYKNYKALALSGKNFDIHEIINQLRLRDGGRLTIGHNSFTMRDYGEYLSHFWPSIVRIGVADFSRVPDLNSRWATYGVSFGRFFGGDLWLNKSAFRSINVKKHFEFFLSNLPSNTHPNYTRSTGIQYSLNSVNYSYSEKTVSFDKKFRVRTPQGTVNLPSNAPGESNYLIHSHTT